MTALILIDMQAGFDDAAYWSKAGQGGRNSPKMEENARAVLAHARENSWHIFHIQHASSDPQSPLSPEQAGFAFKAGFEPRAGEVHLTKSVNSGFIGTDLEAQLRELGEADVVICGISTEHCVSTTTRMAGNLGFDVRLVGDACHAWPHGRFDAQEVHDMELALLDGEFAQVVRASDIIRRS